VDRYAASDPKSQRDRRAVDAATDHEGPRQRMRAAWTGARRSAATLAAPLAPGSFRDFVGL